MYLATLGVFFALAVWLEIRFHVHLYGTRKERILITSIFFVIGVGWDSISTIEKTGFIRVMDLSGFGSVSCRSKSTCFRL